MSTTLTLVCRRAELIHEAALDPSTGTYSGATLYRHLGFAHGVQLSRGAQSKGDSSIGGAWSQCGETVTFTGETLTAAVDQSVRAGWDVDSPWLGFYTRGDLCPACNPHHGRRPLLHPDDVRVGDTMAA